MSDQQSMFDTSLKAPGAYFEAVSPSDDIETLRTDIAGFIGPTERGPVSVLTRVNGWRDYVTLFGGETHEHDMPFCIRGYFENGGEAAYIVRTLGAPCSAAWQEWHVDELEFGQDPWLPATPMAGGFLSSRYRIEAASPGLWANGLRVAIEYRLQGNHGDPEVTIKVTPVRGAKEFLRAIRPSHLVEQVAEKSRLIRMIPLAGSVTAVSPNRGPLHVAWQPLELKCGKEKPADLNQYLADVHFLLADPEVALIVIPDMYRLAQPYDLLARVAWRAELTLDRQLIASLPEHNVEINQTKQWVDLRREELNSRGARAVAVYQPWLDVPNPLGGVIHPLRRVSPVGHVAGLISRLDRQRGAHHTPANATLVDAVDMSRNYEESELGALVDIGSNPIRCRHGRGLEVWGGRTLADRQSDPEGLYLAHRRLMHRLVRAIRRVADPLVFSINGPEFWLILVRAITTVLLQAYRAGSLKGETPEEAFRVVCDESNNPPNVQELGQVMCEIQFAPAVPMEFITLRIAISTEGRLELISA